MILLVVLVPLLAGLFLLAMERIEAGVLPLRNGVAPVPAPASVDSATHSLLSRQLENSCGLLR